MVQPKPQPVIPPPQAVKAPDPIPEPTITEAKVEAPKPDATAPTPGTGGGTGKDGTNGSGPGTGGGNGSGIGTGKGSGIGPGTGGGIAGQLPPDAHGAVHSAAPHPGQGEGFHLIAEYDVDSTGKVVDFKFTPTRDGGYNKRLDEVLKSFKFRPGTTPGGLPISHEGADHLRLLISVGSRRPDVCDLVARRASVTSI